MKVFKDLEQGTDEWKAIRKGKPTASRFSDIITAAKGELSKSATGYIRELIGECFCPEWEPWQGNIFMERGKELEAEAREAFKVQTGHKIETVGFVIADDNICGCSPDALITDDLGNYISGAEIKCPIPKTHVGYVMDGGLPDAYKQQVHGSMAVTGLKEWHFWSYFPGMRPHHIIIQRDEYTEKIAAALKDFVSDYRSEMDIAIQKLALPKWAKEAA